MGVKFFCNQCQGEIFQNLTEETREKTTISVIDKLCICQGCFAKELHSTQPMKIIAVSPESLWYPYRDLLEKKVVYPQKIFKKFRNGDVKGIFMVNIQGRQRQIFISRVKLGRGG